MCVCVCVCVCVLSQVKGVMSDNINKVVERGEKLDDLEERAGKGVFVPISMHCSHTVILLYIYPLVCRLFPKF